MDSNQNLTPRQFKNRQRFMRISTFVFIALVVVLVSLIDSSPKSTLSSDQKTQFKQLNGIRGRVVKVVDGDTVDVELFKLKNKDGQPLVERIRLWGIDTPETEKIRHGELLQKGEPYADEATQLTRELCMDKIVELKLQEWRIRGYYGRLLAYIVLSDGTELGEHLLAAGYARSEDRWHHEKMKRYELLELGAKKDKVGIWGKK